METEPINEGDLEITSEEVAAEKLRKLSAEDFSAFAVRYMNIEEYRGMIADRKVGDQEASWMGDNGENWPFAEEYMSEAEKKEPRNFDTFLKRASEFWPGSSNVMTSTGVMGSSAILGYTELTNLLKRAHKKAKVVSDSSLSVRQRTIELLGGYLKQWSPHEGELNGLRKMRGWEAIEDTDDIDPDSKDALERVITDPQNSTKEDLRLIFDNSIRPYRDKDPSASVGWEFSPYHIAVIYDKGALTDSTSWNKDSWRYLDETSTGSNVLGAIALVPNRKVYEEMIQLSSSSHDWAHPVFSPKGNILYPSKS